MPRTLSQNASRTGKKRPAQGAIPATPVAGNWLELSEAPLIHLLLLALVALVAYADTFQVPFIFDDRFSIVDNPVIKDLRTFLSGAGYTYNPRRFIGYLSFALNYRLGGLNVAGYHAVNLAVHILAAWLVYLLVRITLHTPFFRGREPVSGTTGHAVIMPHAGYFSLFVALLFVAHPVQTQAVTYIVQRVASMATLFYLLALVLYLKARLTIEAGRVEVAGIAADVLKNQNRPVTIIRSPFILFTLSFVAALLAMRTKEIAVTLPLAVILYELAFFGARARKWFGYLLPSLLLLLLVTVGMMQAGRPLGELLSDVSRMTRETQLISRSDYLLTQFSVIVTYIRLLVFPVGQNLDYDYPVFDTLYTPRVFFSFLFLMALCAGAIYCYRRSAVSGNRSPADGMLRLIAFGISWFFITLAVESSVIPISDVIFEHRLYLPSVGAFIAIAAGAAFICRRCAPGSTATAAAIIVVILAAATWHRNTVWQDDIVLWRDVAAKSPNKYRPHNNLALVLLGRGELDEAVREYRIVAELCPGDADARSNLGVAYFRKGLVDRAMAELLAAVRLNPGFVTAHNNLGEVYLRQNLLDKAIESYLAAVTLKPDYAEARNNLGGACLRKGWTDRAIDEYRSAVKIKPEEANFHFNLAAAYERKGWDDRAADEYRLALALQPADSEARRRLEVLSRR